MRNYIIHVAVLLISYSASAKVTPHNTANIDCKLDSNQKLVIGCTNYCGKFNRWAIKRYARRLGYKVDIINLRSRHQTVDYTAVDGILMPGGSDIHPDRYISQQTPEMQAYLKTVAHLYEPSKIGPIRDEFEFNLLEKYFANENSRYQPILGICRGMQALTVSQGIPMYVDIQHELGIKNRRYTLDRINVQNPESLIMQTAGKRNFRAVKLHHQGLRLDYFLKHQDRWPHLEVTATSHNNRIAEALEFYNRPVMGVQFHPEWTLFSKTRRGIFSWLLKRACFNKVLGPKILKQSQKDLK